MSKKATQAAEAQAQALAAPQGQRLGRAAGPGTLSPGAGVEARRTAKAIYCGRIVGMAHGFTDHPNSKDPAKVSTRFLGSFLCIDPEGAQTAHMECYLPGVFGNGLRAQLSRPTAEPVGFALEIWAEPDEVTGRKTAQGFEYAVYNNAPRRQVDPVLQLAMEAGFVKGPALPAPGIAAPEIDPETGEVIRPSERA
jgi:hypothetical protein